MLLFAKTLMGIGASAGLMSAFMANNLNLDKKSLAIGNGFTLLMGNLGLLFSTVPAYYIISNFNWRIFNFCLSMSCISLSFILFLLIPPKPSIKTPVSDYLKKAKFILQQRIFFKMLLLMIPLGIFDSMQAFWSQFWLNKIAQIKHDEVEVYLFIMNIGVGLGMLSTGLFDRFWQRIGFKSMQMIYIFLILSLIVQWLIFSFWLHSCSHTLWFIYGFSTQFALLSYAVLCNNFAVEISGRVITLLNFFLFIIGYCYQSSMGKLIQYHISTNMIFKFFVIIQFIFLCIAMSIPHGPSKNN
jgi:MFS family permease